MASPEDWKTIGVISKSKAIDNVEKQWSRDMPAYKRLRQDGTQPKRIDGCAELEARAVDRQEIEMGHLYKNEKEKVHMQEGMRLAEEMRLGIPHAQA